MLSHLLMVICGLRGGAETRPRSVWPLMPTMVPGVTGGDRGGRKALLVDFLARISGLYWPVCGSVCLCPPARTEDF